MKYPTAGSVRDSSRNWYRRVRAPVLSWMLSQGRFANRPCDSLGKGRSRTATSQ